MATANRSKKPRSSAAGLKARGVALSVCGALIAAPMPALSTLNEVAGLKDLVERGDDYAAREMRDRGWVLTHRETRPDRVFQYWWQARETRCARVGIKDGRVAGIKSVDEHDCNQSSGVSDGAKVAIAAAAIIGVAALAHKSHENDKDRNEQSPQDVAEFDRGYRDGLYHQSYHNYNNTSNYSDGYQRGSEKRATETSYRSDQGYHSGNAGYVNVQDLVGARGSSVDDELRRRGFVNKGSYTQGERAISMWWNGSTRQCLSMTVRDGRAQRLESIVEGNCL